MEAGISLMTMYELNCPICLEDCNAKTLSELNSCSHFLCEDCFKDLIKYSNKCPLCAQIFSSCKYKERDNYLYEYFIGEVDLNNINKHMMSLYKEENFECFTSEGIKRELNYYEKLADNLKMNLFMKRNCDGSEKEYIIYEQVIEKLFECNNALMTSEFIDTKNLMKDLDFIIQEINHLKKRTYVFNYY
jgi:hypothetical protein